MQRSHEPVAVLVGGDAPTRAMMRFLLKDDGCEVIEVANMGALAAVPGDIDIALLVLVASEREDEVLANLVRLRLLSYRPPILLLTHGTSRDLRRRAFAHGVQDVVNLPTSAHDLRERLRAILGQGARQDQVRGDVESVRAGGLTLRSASREVSDGVDWSVRLTRREAALLKVLMLTPGQPVDYQELLERIWGAQAAGHTNALAVLVRRLRGKLVRPGFAHGYVRTVHGRGYVFDARSAQRPSQETSPAHGPRVLVVEDDHATANLVAEILQRAGYTVTLGSGAEAPALARTLWPTVILLDLNMPDVHGVEVRRRLRAHPRTASIPVIAFSAGGNLRAHGAELTADDYLAKPFGVDELLLRIEKWAGPAVGAPPEGPARP
jgi:DNA-binding response OmpR family regulator